MMLPLLLLLQGPPGPVLTPQTTGSDAEFRGLHAVDERVVWASGSGGRYVRTTDGGRSWQADSIRGAAELFLVDIHAFGADTAVVVGTSFKGGEARIYRTTDGGAHWSESWSLRHPNVFLDGLAFWDARHGIAFSDPVDGSFLILRTEDGGASWQPVPREAIPSPLPGEAAFAASGTNLAVRPGGLGWLATGGGAHARVFRTADYGRTWTAAETPLPGSSTAGIFGLAFRSDLEGVAVGGVYDQPALAQPNVLRTRDGGKTWTLAGSTEPVGVKYGVAGRGNRLLAPAPAGTAWSNDGGASWHALPTTSYNTASFASEGVAWLAGVKGGIARVTFE